MRTIAVYLLFRNERGEYLLQRRQNTGYMDEHYDFGATGHLEAGESIEACVVREAKEEVGVNVQPSDLKLIRISQTSAYGDDYMGFYFLCEKWQCEPTICEPEKCDDLGWYAPNDFPEKVTNGVRIIQYTDFREDFEFFYSDSYDPLENIGTIETE